MELMHATAISGAGVLALSLVAGTQIASAEQAVEKNVSHRSVGYILSGAINPDAKDPNIIRALKFPRSKTTRNGVTDQGARFTKFTRNGKPAGKWVKSNRFWCIGPDDKPGTPDCSIQTPALVLKDTRRGLVGRWQVQIEWRDGQDTQLHNYAFRTKVIGQDGGSNVVKITR